MRRDHIVIIDGTLSRIDAGLETNAGLAYKFLSHFASSTQRVYYDAGVQGQGLLKWLNIAIGEGVNQSVENSYYRLAEFYNEGDRIFLLGYSRGAYAVRLLAGLIQRIGLLRANFASRKLAIRALNHFDEGAHSKRAAQFSKTFCLQNVPIEFIGVWDTVKALGVPLPLLSRFTPLASSFHDHSLPKNVKIAYQALTLDETRRTFQPEYWQSFSPSSKMQQRVFPGAHADIGGQRDSKKQSRGLSNISLHWMMEKLESFNLQLKPNWQDAYPIDPSAPIMPYSRPFRLIPVHRQARKFTPPEYFQIDKSVFERMSLLPKYRPTNLPKTTKILECRVNQTLCDAVVFQKSKRSGLNF